MNSKNKAAKELGNIYTAEGYGYDEMINGGLIYAMDHIYKKPFGLPTDYKKESHFRTYADLDEIKNGRETFYKNNITDDSCARFLLAAVPGAQSIILDLWGKTKSEIEPLISDENTIYDQLCEHVLKAVKMHPEWDKWVSRFNRAVITEESLRMELIKAEDVPMLREYYEKAFPNQSFEPLTRGILERIEQQTRFVDEYVFKGYAKDGRILTEPSKYKNVSKLSKACREYNIPDSLSGTQEPDEKNKENKKAEKLNRKLAGHKETKEEKPKNPETKAESEMTTREKEIPPVKKKKTRHPKLTPMTTPKFNETVEAEGLSDIPIVRGDSLATEPNIIGIRRLKNKNWLVYKTDENGEIIQPTGHTDLRQANGMLLRHLREKKQEMMPDLGSALKELETITGKDVAQI